MSTLVVPLPMYPSDNLTVVFTQSMQSIYSISSSSVKAGAEETLSPRDIEIYYSKIHQAITAYTVGTGLDPADLTQETFLKAHKNKQSFQGNASLYTWLYRIARNTCIDAMRKLKTERGQQTLTSFDEMYYEPEVTSPEIEKREAKRLLDVSLARLDESLRILIVLKDLQGLPYHEIAEITQINEGTVKSRLFKARLQLRQELIKLGYTP